jgi:5'-nucleotidase
MTARPRILVTNDGWIDRRLWPSSRRWNHGEVTVIAPETNQSAVGHSRTMWRPLRVRERTLADGSAAWSIDGSPSDAVGLVFLGLLPGPIDLVASGINHGANLGDDITYSGTVSAAMEAVLNGCPAFAISLDDYAPHDFELAKAAARVVARAILARGLEPAQLLNVNVPAISPAACAGFEVARLGKRTCQDELIRREDPRGVPYYWVGGSPPTGHAIPGTDVDAVLNNRVAITPIQLDLTADRFLERCAAGSSHSRSNPYRRFRRSAGSPSPRCAPAPRHPPPGCAPGPTR